MIFFLDEYRINVPYKLYWKIFDTFNIAFGYPRSDTCSTCDQLRVKLASDKLTSSDTQRLDTLKELHHRKANAFAGLKRHFKGQAKDGLATVISFDYMQNLPVPQLTTNKIFYARQLWYYVFGVHDLANKGVTMFTYHEGNAKKGQNEVTSFLFNYLTRKEDLQRKLVLISDRCSGQNKNFVMMYFLYMLVHCLKLSDSVTYLFPVRGHSFLPNDQTFR